MNQIKQVLFVLLAAVLGGFILAFSLIWHYGPTGKYKASQSIIAPEIIQGINFKDLHPKTGKLTLFQFDTTEFVYFDFITGKWIQMPIPLETYASFYSFIQQDESLDNPSPDIVNLFQHSTPTALVTTVRTEVLPTAKAFQVIQFTKEGYYRVKLHGQDEEGKWAYFYHEGIFAEIMKRFLQKSVP